MRQRAEVLILIWLAACFTPPVEIYFYKILICFENVGPVLVEVVMSGGLYCIGQSCKMLSIRLCLRVGREMFKP